MITENDKREDKFCEMSSSIFNECVWFALRNGDRKVAYSKIKKGMHTGGMADNLEDALYWCKRFYNEDKTVELCIADFRKAPTIWQTNDILHELGIMSDEEYDKYILEIDYED